MFSVSYELNFFYVTEINVIPQRVKNLATERYCGYGCQMVHTLDFWLVVVVNTKIIVGNLTYPFSTYQVSLLIMLLNLQFTDYVT